MHMHENSKVLYLIRLPSSLKKVKETRNFVKK